MQLPALHPNRGVLRSQRRDPQWQELCGATGVRQRPARVYDLAVTALSWRCPILSRSLGPWWAGSEDAALARIGSRNTPARKTGERWGNLGILAVCERLEITSLVG